MDSFPPQRRRLETDFGRTFSTWGMSDFRIFHFCDDTLWQKDSARVQHVFSAETRPCLWQAIPAIEELQTAWEKKRDDPQYRLFVDPIEDALDKIKKYYNRFDEKPWIILSLGTCLIFKPKPD